MSKPLLEMDLQELRSHASTLAGVIDEVANQRNELANKNAGITTALKQSQAQCQLLVRQKEMLEAEVRRLNAVVENAESGKVDLPPPEGPKSPSPRPSRVKPN